LCGIFSFSYLALKVKCAEQVFKVVFLNFFYLLPLFDVIAFLNFLTLGFNLILFYVDLVALDIFTIFRISLA